MLEQHDALRLRFEQQGDSWRQRYAAETETLELRVERWQGFIFVTESATQVSLRDYMGAEVYDRFARWRLDECYTALWVGKVINANWKAVSDRYAAAVK